MEKRRAKPDRRSAKKCGLCHSTDKGSMGKQRSNSSAFFESSVEIIRGQCEINDEINFKMAIYLKANQDELNIN